MRKITIVGVRRGERVLHRPALLYCFVLMWFAGASAVWLLDGIRTMLFAADGFRPVSRALGMSLVMSATLLSIFVLRTWRVPVDRLPALDARD